MRLVDFISTLIGRGFTVTDSGVVFAIEVLRGVRHPLFLDARDPLPGSGAGRACVDAIEITFDQADTLTAALAGGQRDIHSWHRQQYGDFLFETHTDADWLAWQQEVLYQVAVQYPAPFRGVTLGPYPRYASPAFGGMQVVEGQSPSQVGHASIRRSDVYLVAARGLQGARQLLDALLASDSDDEDLFRMIHHLSTIIVDLDERYVAEGV